MCIFNKKSNSFARTARAFLIFGAVLCRPYQNNDHSRTNFQLSLDINSVHSSLIPGQLEHILHAERVRIIHKDYTNYHKFELTLFVVVHGLVGVV